MDRCSLVCSEKSSPVPGFIFARTRPLLTPGARLPRFTPTRAQLASADLPTRAAPRRPCAQALGPPGLCRQQPSGLCSQAGPLPEANGSHTAFLMQNWESSWNQPLMVLCWASVRVRSPRCLSSGDCYVWPRIARPRCSGEIWFHTTDNSVLEQRDGRWQPGESPRSLCLWPGL